MKTDRFIPIAYLLLRLVAGWMLFQAGAMKIFAWYGGMPDGAAAAFMSQTWIGGVLEVVGGILIMVGLGTRITAFILCGMMAVAYWQFHAPNGGWPVQNGGLPAALYCFVFLYMAVRGGSDYSIDALIRKRRAGAV